MLFDSSIITFLLDPLSSVLPEADGRFSGRSWALSARNLELLSTLEWTEEVAMLKSLSPMASLSEERSYRPVLLLESLAAAWLTAYFESLLLFLVLTMLEFFPEVVPARVAWVF